MEIHIQTERTALVQQLGTYTDNTKYVLICLHGFAQLAKDFIQYFSPLLSDNCIIIAPEGLSRSYFNKHTTIGASWMTSYERETEIEDYIHYLNKVFFQLYLSKQRLDLPVYVLGFSQGVATACRWLAKDQCKVDGIILCSGTPAYDTKLSESKNFKKPVHIVYGENDPIIGKEKLQTITEFYNTEHIRAQLHSFEGAHDIDISTIQQILNQLTK